MEKSITFVYLVHLIKQDVKIRFDGNASNLSEFISQLKVVSGIQNLENCLTSIWDPELEDYIRLDKFEQIQAKGKIQIRESSEMHTNHINESTSVTPSLDLSSSQIENITTATTQSGSEQELESSGYDLVEMDVDVADNDGTNNGNDNEDEVMVSPSVDSAAVDEILNEKGTTEEALNESRKKRSNWSKGLSITKDTLELAGMGTKVGFTIAKTGTKLGFTIGRKCIRGPAHVMDAVLPYNPISLGLKAVDKAVGCAEHVTVGCMDISQKVTTKTITTSHQLLHKAGVKDGGLIQKLGELVGQTELTDALVLIIKVLYNGLEPSTNYSPSSLIAAAQTFAYLQRECRPTLVGPSVAEIDAYYVRRFMLFAGAAYGPIALTIYGVVPLSSSTNADIIQKITGINAEDILVSNWNGSLYSPAYFLAVDHRTRSIVLTMRGTNNPHDVLTDLVCKQEPFTLPFEPDLHGFAHKGFLLAAQRLSKELWGPVKEALDKYEGYQLILCGHSLGAAVSAMITVFWVELVPNIHCYAYAEPCVMSLELSQRMGAYITGVCNEDDMVCRFSEATTLDLRNALNRLCDDIDLDVAVKRAMSQVVLGADNSVKHPSLNTVLNFLREQEMREPKLYPAGHMLYIGNNVQLQPPMKLPQHHHLPSDAHMEKIPNCVIYDQSHLGELVLSSTMFVCHLPHVYMNVLGCKMAE